MSAYRPGASTVVVAGSGNAVAAGLAAPVGAAGVLDLGNGVELAVVSVDVAGADSGVVPDVAIILIATTATKPIEPAASTNLAAFTVRDSFHP